MTQSAYPTATDFTAVRADYRSMAVIVATLAGLFLAFLAMTLWANQGHFVYTLDAGTYSHLALAEQIRQGGYGFNPGEFAAPSSNILYPYLVALLCALGLGQFAPFLLCVVSTLALGPVVTCLAAECRLRLDEVDTLWLAALTVALTLALNLVGLAFTGLEHSLHILLTVTCLLGLMRFLRRGQTDWWWLVSIIVLPLIRYEALAALLADVLLLLLFRKVRYALFVAAASLSLVGAFGLYLHAHGLSYLPDSVLFRSQLASNSLELQNVGIGGLLHTLALTFKNNVISFGATHILFMLVVICWSLSTWHGWSRSNQRADWMKPSVVLFCVIVSAAQLAAGSLQSHSSRYEAYVLALEVCTILICYQERLAAFFQHASARLRSAACLALLILGAGYAIHTIDIVRSTQVVYEGPYQIRRFVLDYYKQPIASTHPGVINYRNPYYVLDLSGQISKTARLAITSRADAQWMDALMREHGVGLALLHGDDELSAPPQWLPIGKLETRHASIFREPSVATFFAINPGDKEKIGAQLKDFIPTLPPGTSFVFANTGDGARSR